MSVIAGNLIGSTFARSAISHGNCGYTDDKAALFKLLKKDGDYRHPFFVMSYRQS